MVSSGGMRGASLRLWVSIPWLRLVARCAGEASLGTSSPVDRNMRKGARGAASMSLYQSVNMLGEHVTVLSEWMGGSDGRDLSVDV